MLENGNLTKNCEIENLKGFGYEIIDILVNKAKFSIIVSPLEKCEPKNCQNLLFMGGVNNAQLRVICSKSVFIRFLLV